MTILLILLLHMSRVSSVHSSPTSRDVIYSAPIHDENDVFQGELEIYENEEPIDIISEFIAAKNLSRDYRHALLSSACEVVVCTRLEAAVFRQFIDLGYAEMVEMLILEGEEPADAVYSFCVEYELGDDGREMLMSIVNNEPSLQPYITRQVALIWEQPVQGEELNHSGRSLLPLVVVIYCHCHCPCRSSFVIVDRPCFYRLCCPCLNGTWHNSIQSLSC